jgi:gliding motility associated protien GldN
MKSFSFVIVLLLILNIANGQAPEVPQYNPNSLSPIPRYEQLYKYRVWRDIDLNEKQNEGFFSNNGQISKLIVNAIKSGELATIYESDSMTTIMPKANFLKLLVATQATTWPDWDPNANYLAQDVVTFNGVSYEAQADNSGKNPSTSTDEWAVTTQGKGAEYLPSDMVKMRLMEDMIFDRRRSRLYYDIQAVQLIVPGTKTMNQVDNELGWVKYKDLEKVFRNHPREAVWFNRYNTAENKNFADAFILRLFKGVLYKIENPDDATIQDIYSGNGRPYKESVWARDWEEMRLMEKEHNLWEY